MNPFVYMFVIKPPSELALRLAMILLVAAALEALAGLLLIRRKTAAKTVLAALSFLSAAAALALLLITPGAGALDPMPPPLSLTRSRPGIARPPRGCWTARAGC